jgi:hypothetical protein
MRSKMATRSSSNKGTDRRALNVPPPARNTQDNTQAVRRIPGVDYGEQKALTEQQQAAPLPKTARESTLRKAQQEGMQRRGMKPPAIDVFATTNRKSEPVTAGLPFGPGVNPQPQQQVLKAEEVRDFIYDSWLETGDDSLLEYI